MLKTGWQSAADIVRFRRFSLSRFVHAMRGLRSTAAVTVALDYARASVPDAIAALKPGQTVLKDLATAKLQSLATATAAEVVKSATTPAVADAAEDKLTQALSAAGAIKP